MSEGMKHLEQSPRHRATHHLSENSWYFVTGGFVFTFCCLCKCECVFNTEITIYSAGFPSYLFFNKDRRKSFYNLKALWNGMLRAFELSMLGGEAESCN